MLQNTLVNLPSPPTSPHMTFGTHLSDTGWQTQSPKDLGLTLPTAENGLTPSNSEPENSGTPSSLQSGPSARPSVSTNHSYSHTAPESDEANYVVQDDSQPPDSVFNFPDPTDDALDPTAEGDSSPFDAAHEKVSNPSSPTAHAVVGDNALDHSGEEQDAIDDFELDVEDGEDGEPKRELTAAEIRAQKRKMKRFRLTHNQTRFLMSEFARQAHPDAAHRERLAREIPGLSPRQVQVWFQNRRAKLKRLTSDDRERMMRSRALPDNFDSTHALHSPFGTMNPGAGTPLASPAGYSSVFQNANGPRPLTLDTMRRPPPEAANMSPTGISPAFGAFSFTPPQSATDSLPPATPQTNEHSPFGYGYPPSTGAEPPQRRVNPFISPATSGPGFPPQSYLPRLSIGDRFGLSRAEPVSSPLRTTTSFSGPEVPPEAVNGSLDYSDVKTTTASPSADYMPHRSMSVSAPMGPYGMANPTAMPSFSQTHPGARMHSFSHPARPRIDSVAASQYKPALGRISTPQTSHFAGFHGPPLASPPPPPSQASAPYNISTFPHSFLRDDAHPDHAWLGAGPADDATPLPPEQPVGLAPGF